MANEKRLIDANKFMRETYFQEGIYPHNMLKKEIEAQPTVDAVEVVYGQWEDFCRGKMCCCSVCKAEFDNTCNEIHDEWHYCPNCGAKMDGDGNDI